MFAGVQKRRAGPGTNRLAPSHKKHPAYSHNVHNVLHISAVLHKIRQLIFPKQPQELAHRASKKALWSEALGALHISTDTETHSSTFGAFRRPAHIQGVANMSQSPQNSALRVNTTALFHHYIAAYHDWPADLKRYRSLKPLDMVFNLAVVIPCNEKGMISIQAQTKYSRIGRVPDFKWDPNQLQIITRVTSTEQQQLHHLCNLTNSFHTVIKPQVIKIFLNKGKPKRERRQQSPFSEFTRRQHTSGDTPAGVLAMGWKVSCFPAIRTTIAIAETEQTLRRNQPVKYCGPFLDGDL